MQAMQEQLRTDLVIAALERAAWKRRPAEGVMHHADHGCHYTSRCFGQQCAAGIRSSMGTVGDGYANALVESFFAPLECELLAQCRFPTHAQARAAIFDWIEVFSNRQRRHSALGYVAPDVYERTVTTQATGVA